MNLFFSCWSSKHNENPKDIIGDIRGEISIAPIITPGEESINSSSAIAHLKNQRDRSKSSSF